MLCVITSNCDFLKAVEETFEQELHQAILLSKLAYEEQLVSAATSEKEPESNKKSGKKTKKATMSLEEFNSMGSNVTQDIVLTPELEVTQSKSKGRLIPIFEVFLFSFYDIHTLKIVKPIVIL